MELRIPLATFKILVNLPKFAGVIGTGRSALQLSEKPNIISALCPIKVIYPLWYFKALHGCSGVLVRGRNQKEAWNNLKDYSPDFLAVFQPWIPLDAAKRFQETSPDGWEYRRPRQYECMVDTQTPN